MYAILENVPLVDGVILQLKRTQSILDDLDESLKVRTGPYLVKQAYQSKERPDGTSTAAWCWCCVLLVHGSRA